MKFNEETLTTIDNYTTTCPHVHCATCDDWKCRCGDCIALIESNGKWVCDFENKECERIKTCMEYL